MSGPDQYQTVVIGSGSYPPRLIAQFDCENRDLDLRLRAADFPHGAPKCGGSENRRMRFAVP